MNCAEGTVRSKLYRPKVKSFGIPFVRHGIRSASFSVSVSEPFKQRIIAPYIYAYSYRLIDVKDRLAGGQS